MDIRGITQPSPATVTLSKSVSSIPLGGSFEAVSHDPSTFDIRPQSERPLQHYVNEGRHGSAGSIVSTRDSLPTLINAQEDSHKLVSNEYSARNVDLYQAHMRDLADKSVTVTTVSVAGVLVGLETINGEAAVPFDSATDYSLMNTARQLFEASNADFTTFIDKLKATYNDQVSIETFAPGQGPDVAQTHQLLNNSSYDDFVNAQANHMREILAYKEDMNDTQARALAFSTEVSSRPIDTASARTHSVNSYTAVSDLR